jgi:hypothetical protein
MSAVSLKKTGYNLFRALTDTVEIEKVLENYLCPLQMFLELTENGFSYGALKILRHDLNVKRIFLTRTALKYAGNIAVSVKNTPAASENTYVQPAESLPPWGNIVSIPLFTFGVIYAIVRAVSRGSLKAGDRI